MGNYRYSKRSNAGQDTERSQCQLIPPADEIDIVKVTFQGNRAYAKAFAIGTRRRYELATTLSRETRGEIWSTSKTNKFKRDTYKSQDIELSALYRNSRQNSMRYSSKGDSLRDNDKLNRPDDRLSKLALRLESSISIRLERVKYSERDVRRDAKLFIRFGIRTLGEIELSNQKHRAYPERDMGKARYLFEDLELIVDIFDISPPTRRFFTKQPKVAFGDVNIPLSLKNFRSAFPISPTPIGRTMPWSMRFHMNWQLQISVASLPVFEPYI